MKLATVTHKDGSIQVFVTVETEDGAIVESMTLAEWSKLIANPKTTEE
jgi:hypothetical protein